MQKIIGVLGGTFDPIHNGHLHMALELYQQLALDQVRFVPCRQSVLKTNTHATAEQRLAMLQLAIKEQPNFVIDERELQRATPSYTIDTLISLRAEFSNVSLCWIMGADSFNELPQWQRWQELLQYAHLIVVPRPDCPLTTTGVLKDFLQQHEVKDKQQLKEQAAGKIYQALSPMLAISSTDIRHQLAQGLSPCDLMPSAVWHYLQQHHLYRNNL